MHNLGTAPSRSSSDRPGARVRVLHICRRYRPFIGGTEKIVRDLAMAQAEAGLKVTVLTLDHDIFESSKRLPARETLDGVEVIRVRGWGTRQVAFTFRPDRIWREIARHDVVHIHDLRFSLALSVLGASVARRPRILHTHGLIFHTGGGRRLKRLAMRLYFGPLLRLGHVWIAASSDADRTLLLGDAPYLASLTTTIPNAIPLERLLSLDRDPIPGRVVSIGRMAPNKALTDLVRALARVHDVEWSLLLAGERDPEELAHITAETDRLMVRDRVTFVFGFGDEELPRLLSSAALAAFPSKGEGFGIALLEAMAAGVPVLARRIPAHELLLGDDLADGLVDFSDPDAAADAISGLLTADRDELAGLSTRLRARAADFGIGRLQSQIEELYTRLRVRAHAEGRP